MENIKETLFGDPSTLYIVLAALELAFIVVWFYRRTPWTQRLLLAPVLLGGLVLGLDALVETDHEKIMATVKQMAADFEAGRMEDIGQYIDESYNGFGGQSKAEVVERLNAEQGNRQIESIKVTSLDLQVNGRMAEMQVTTLIGLQGGQFPLRWRLTWIERDGTWRLANAAEPQRTVPGFGL